MFLCPVPASTDCVLHCTQLDTAEWLSSLTQAVSIAWLKGDPEVWFVYSKDGSSPSNISNISLQGFSRYCPLFSTENFVFVISYLRMLCFCRYENLLSLWCCRFSTFLTLVTSVSVCSESTSVGYIHLLRFPLSLMIGTCWPYLAFTQCYWQVTRHITLWLERYGESWQRGTKVQKGFCVWKKKTDRENSLAPQETGSYSGRL